MSTPELPLRSAEDPASVLPSNVAGTARMSVGVPAYFPPGRTWSAALAAAPTIRYMIANPSSGPGETPDPAYAAVVAASRNAGVEVFGYVSTRWGGRAVERVRADIHAYQHWYGISNIFLDETASPGTHLEYYDALAATIRQTSGARVALNPGIVPDERYALLADVLVVFEGPCSSYRSWEPPVWQARHPRERFWHLVYATPEAELGRVLRTARSRAAGVIYVTDHPPDNPWDRLPSYWPTVVDAVRNLDRWRWTPGR